MGRKRSQKKRTPRLVCPKNLAVGQNFRSTKKLSLSLSLWFSTGVQDGRVFDARDSTDCANLAGRGLIYLVGEMEFAPQLKSTRTCPFLAGRQMRSSFIILRAWIFRVLIRLRKLSRPLTMPFVFKRITTFNKILSQHTEDQKAEGGGEQNPFLCDGLLSTNSYFGSVFISELSSLFISPKHHIEYRSMDY